jgi:catechol 2,3-dioxygenase-like lactoylglutathione lyase family enzyme
MIDHVTANVGDFEQAKRFYAQALAPLGYSVQMEFEGAAGWDRRGPGLLIGSSPDAAAPPRVQCERSRKGGRVHEAATAAERTTAPAPPTITNYYAAYARCGR